MTFRIPRNYFDAKFFSSGVYKDYRDYRDDVLAWVKPTAQKINTVIRNLENPKILDVGCAQGFLIAELQNKYGFVVRGLEYSKYAVKSADRSVKKKIISGDILNSRHFPKNSFEVVICFDVFEYLNGAEMKKAAKNLALWSKKYIFFNTLYKHSKQSSQKINPDPHRLSPLRQPDYVQMFKNNSLELIKKFTSGGEILVFEKK